MKKKLIVLGGLFTAFAFFIAARFFILDKTSNEGILKVLSSPQSSVFLNNNAIGKTPFEDKAPTGEYMLKLIPEGAATETASWQGKVKIYKNALTYVDRELGTSELSSSGVIFSITKMTKKPISGSEGEISVETEPEGAIVYLDNDEKDIAPLLLKNVPEGEHELSVRAPGFFPRSQKVNVVGGFRINAIFKLALDPAFKKVELAENEATASATPGPKANITAIPTPTTQTATSSAIIIITDTPTGWLRVRTQPSINASESAKVKPGDKFKVLDEKAGWYKINYEAKKEGWISARYTKKEE